jgi:hypothetical protein
MSCPKPDLLSREMQNLYQTRMWRPKEFFYFIKNEANSFQKNKIWLFLFFNKREKGMVY